MKVSLNWLKDYVDLPEDLTIEQLAYDLTMRTVEVEGVETPADKLDGIVIGVIKEVSQHPDADKLAVCIVDAGQDHDLQIVCGGSNVYVGQKVAVAVPGSWVRWHGEGEPVEIKAAELRGVMSEGMICGANELDLEDVFPAEETHIIDLTEFEANPGDDLAKVISLDDYVLEIDNKSMTHRPDLWGHYGIARELSAIYGTEFRPIEEFNIEDDLEEYPVSIETDYAKAYEGYVIENLDLELSPLEMRLRLWELDVRPINNLVDITNYVMLTTGNPTHAFDAKHVENGIVVRQAKEGETLELLKEDTTLTLDTDDCVITDGEKPIALGGVMGGKNDSILPETNSMILEIASFDARAIRRTSQRHNVRTESSTRFEKDIDTDRIEDTKNLSLRLIKNLLPNSKLVAYGRADKKLTEPVEIEVDYAYLSARIGVDVSHEDIEKTLLPLGFEILSHNDESFVVRAPIWRSTGDIELPADILEEVCRMIGYENFEFIAPEIVLEEFVNQPRVDMKRNLSEYFARRYAYQEVFTYPWVDDHYIEAASIDASEWLELEAPPSPSQSKLRASLVPGLLESAVKNTRYRNNFKLFELAQVFSKGYETPSDSDEVLPEQRNFLGGILVGDDIEQLFRHAKGSLEEMSRYNHCSNISFAQVEKATWADPKVWLNIISEEEEVIGELALVSPKTAKAAGLKNHFAVIFELNIDVLEPFTSRTNSYEALSQYQTVWQDLNIIVSETVTWKEVKDLLADKVSKLEFTEEYRDKYIGEGKKSILMRYWLDTSEHTLSSEEIEKQSNEIFAVLEREVSAVMKA